MNKLFEDCFTKIQTDMIKVCLEYVEYSAECVYIYASYEANTISCDFFYKIENNIVERHRLNDVGERKYNTSIQRQKECMTILNEDMKRLVSICKEYNRDMPTEIKLRYDVKNNKVNADYQYELMYSNHSQKTADSMAEEWLEFIRQQNVE